MSLEIPVTIKELQKRLGYSRDVLEGFIKEGMPIVQPGGKGTKRTIYISKALKWMEDATEKNKTQTDKGER